MAIVQVARSGTRFAVLVDGVEDTTHPTRGEAIKAALTYKENHS